MRRFQPRILPIRTAKKVRRKRDTSPEHLLAVKAAKELRYARAVARMEKREVKAREILVQQEIEARLQFTRQEKRVMTRKANDERRERERLDYYHEIARLNKGLKARGLEPVKIQTTGRIDSSALRRAQKFAKANPYRSKPPRRA